MTEEVASEGPFRVEERPHGGWDVTLNCDDDSVLVFDSEGYGSKHQFRAALREAGVLEGRERPDTGSEDGLPGDVVAECDPFRVSEDDHGNNHITDLASGNQVVSCMDGDEPEQLATALREAGLLPDDAEASDSDESDATPVEDVMDLRPGDYVTAQDLAGNEQTGTLDTVDLNHTASGNPYTVHFEDDRKWHSQSVEPAEEPAPSPEDVAETWIEAHDGVHDPAYAPLNDGTEIRFNPDQLDNTFCVESDDLRTPNGKGGHWNAHTVEAVDAADVPFSEVPVDE